MVGMTDGGDAAPLPPAGWYSDPWTPSRRRYWNGASWTFSTTDVAALDDPAPPDASPLPEGHGLPAPVARRPAAADTPEATPGKPRQKPIKWILAVVVGLIVGLTGVALSNRSSSKSPSSSSSESATGQQPSPSTTAPLAAAGNDPSAASLASLVVKPEDVPSTADVVILPGGVGLNQETLDLCNGRFPSESRRTARIQDALLDEAGVLVLSTEAVLYGDSGGTTQAFSELRSVVAACPATPVRGTSGDPTVITRFNPPPDATWSQTPTVNRQAYDLTTDDGSGQPRHIIAVYLQRGRALLGVYFSRPEGPQVPVEGQTTVEGIVGVFAGRLAALPTSVVGA